MQAMSIRAPVKARKWSWCCRTNGMDVDLKMASRVTGIDAILGGHTHDAHPWHR